VFVYAVTVYFAGFLLFLLGLSLFMHRENRKFGDNQFTMKLLPPPPRNGYAPVAWHARAHIAGVPGILRPGRPAARPLSGALRRA
jgi:uncharacterized membrane protein